MTIENHCITSYFLINGSNRDSSDASNDDNPDFNWRIEVQIV